ncbi:MAG: ferrochelatase, partial [Candidatus Lindowbacteria bacterium]|nr:ferrochelatase [Candidatus Lindowbacteria bacterium]
KKILVIIPSFAADCLETLEEIDLRGRESFLEAGGESYTMIPCVNDQSVWVDTLVKMTQELDDGTRAPFISPK